MKLSMAKRLEDIDVYEQYKKWSKTAGVFRCFFRATNFVSLQHYPDFELSEPCEKSVYEEQVLKSVDLHSQKGTLYILELPGAAAIRCACALNAERQLNPILTFNCILHSHGLIGGREYISHLLYCADAIRLKETGSWVFVVDADRYSDFNEDELKNSFNNQYEITEEDLPAVEMLRDMLLERVVYIHQGKVKDDMAAYLEYLGENGFLVLMQEIKL